MSRPDVPEGGPVVRARAAAAAVLDPELPVLTIDDLGVLRAVAVDAAGQVTVTLTPTYSGCPAMDAIRDDVLTAVRAAGFASVEVLTVLSPAWTTDWISEAGRRELAAAGIAPPAPAGRPTSGGVVDVLLTLGPPEVVRCPQCGSADTRETSRFGSTACKAMRVCSSCREPFDHVKAI